jgi:hypothetical protein
MTIALLAAFVSPATGQVPGESPSGREWFEPFHEDWENGGFGWTLVDRSRGGCDFHVSTYCAYDDGTLPNYSYWCGTFDYDADGGYGDGWSETLLLPEIDLPVGHGPLKLRFRYRTFTYDHRDFAMVEVQHLGEYRTVWDSHGGSGTWNMSPSIDLEPCDSPLKLRFRVRSNEDRSDEDGYFNSVGGAFHCDEIRVYEFGTGVEYFYDDAEDGDGLCSPVDVPAAGTVPHLIDLPCRAYSDPTTLTCCPPGDTTSVLPNTFCSIISPLIDVEGADQAKVFYAGSNCGLGDVEDVRAYHVSVDGGVSWFLVARNDWESEEAMFCGDFSPYGLGGYDISGLLPAATIRLRLSLLTNEDGIGPGTGGAAGTFLDDVWVEVSPPPTSIEECAAEVTWSRIKGLYR